MQLVWRLFFLFHSLLDGGSLLYVQGLVSSCQMVVNWHDAFTSIARVASFSLPLANFAGCLDQLS